MWTRRARRWLTDWEELVAAQLPQWAELDEPERVRLGSLIEWMVRTRHWEAARGFEPPGRWC
jgi:Mlc titration factor MtfA (ptsG expression regulator)